MALQASTQLDGFGHVGGEHTLYNGYWAGLVTATGGARRLGVHHLARHGIVGRAVLLDVARHLGVEHLEPGFPVGPDELDGAAARAGRRRRRGRHRARPHRSRRLEARSRAERAGGGEPARARDLDPGDSLVARSRRRDDRDRHGRVLGRPARAGRRLPHVARRRAARPRSPRRRAVRSRRARGRLRERSRLRGDVRRRADADRRLERLAAQSRSSSSDGPIVSTAHAAVLRRPLASPPMPNRKPSAPTTIAMIAIVFALSTSLFFTVLVAAGVGVVAPVSAVRTGQRQHRNRDCRAPVRRPASPAPS